MRWVYILLFSSLIVAPIYMFVNLVIERDDLGIELKALKQELVLGGYAQIGTDSRIIWNKPTNTVPILVGTVAITLPRRLKD